MELNSRRRHSISAKSFTENEPIKSGLERAAEIKPMSLADTKTYEGFRQVHDIHKYFVEIKC